MPAVCEIWNLNLKGTWFWETSIEMGPKTEVGVDREWDLLCSVLLCQHCPHLSTSVHLNIHAVDCKVVTTMGYTKLFSSIVASTIWREDDKTRIVWITMLAMKNERHIVEASVPGLADMARVSLAECEAALKKLMSPDKYSRNQGHQGRRIQKCDGGWLILNGEYYRAQLSQDERREYKRKKQLEYRSKKKASGGPGARERQYEKTLGEEGPEAADDLLREAPPAYRVNGVAYQDGCGNGLPVAN